MYMFNKLKTGNYNTGKCNLLKKKANINCAHRLEKKEWKLYTIYKIDSVHTKAYGDIDSTYTHVMQIKNLIFILNN